MRLIINEPRSLPSASNYVTDTCHAVCSPENVVNAGLDLLGRGQVAAVVGDGLDLAGALEHLSDAASKLGLQLLESLVLGLSCGSHEHAGKEGDGELHHGGGGGGVIQ